jgi:hypothetical protein
MFSLTYTSRATRTMLPFDLVSLLNVARDRNAAVGVTGLLLYAQESFLQHLEGEPDAVDAVFERIRADERHTDIRIVAQEDITKRTHDDWAMGFGFPQPDELAKVLPGYEPRFVAPLADESLLDAATASLLLAMVASGVSDPYVLPS